MIFVFNKLKVSYCFDSYYVHFSSSENFGFPSRAPCEAMGAGIKSSSDAPPSFCESTL